MNDEQQKAWGHSQLILAIPRTDKYEYRQYRYDREIERSQIPILPILVLNRSLFVDKI